MANDIRMQSAPGVRHKGAGGMTRIGREVKKRDGRDGASVEFQTIAHNIRNSLKFDPSSPRGPLFAMELTAG